MTDQQSPSTGEPLEPVQGELDSVPTEPSQPSVPPVPAPQPIPASTATPPEKLSRQKRRRRSLFFPILLVVVGVFLLLSNLGLTSGSAWETLIDLWPLLFIVWGLDSLWRGEGLTGAVFLLGLGVVFLLGNFGYLHVNSLQVLLTIWPLILVAIGIDILISRRRNWLTTLLGFIVVLAVLAGALWLSGVGLPGGVQVVTGEKIEFGLQGATRADVSILPAVGLISLDRLDNSDALLTGTIPSSSVAGRITQEFTKVGELAKLKLQSNGPDFFIPSKEASQASWMLELTPSVPVNLEVNMGAGESKLDLTGLQISNLISKVGAGGITVTLPATGNFKAKIDAAIGTITILVPEGMAVQLDTSTALTARSLPAGYVKQGDNSFVSPDIQNAQNRVTLDVGLAVGLITIKQK